MVKFAEERFFCSTIGEVQKRNGGPIKAMTSKFLKNLVHHEYTRLSDQSKMKHQNTAR